MTQLVFFLEEPSAKAMLEGLVPRIIPPGTDCRYFAFEGKQDLEEQLVRKLRGYLVPDAAFIVIRDQDSGDCRAIKERLKGLCLQAGRPEAIIRIACRELESWYLADLPALAKAYNQPELSRHADRSRFRIPDDIVTPSRELKRMLPAYQKIDGSRRMGRLMDPDNLKSGSFALLVRTLRRICVHEEES